MLKFLNGYFSFMVMDAAGGEGGNAGAGGKGKEGEGDVNAQLKAQTERNDALEARLKALEGKGGGGKGDEGDDLSEKARKEREAKEKDAGHQKRLESALKFNMESPNWLKDNASLLPKTVAGIFESANKETYDNAIERDSALKAGIISEFFAVQTNLELLTPTLKATLEDFLKLTKNVKQERAQGIYDTVFEPAFDTLKRVKKAEALGKGVVNPTDAEAAYKSKLIGLSRKHYLGEK